MNFVEKSYNNFLNFILGITNPVKKSIIRTQCQVHKFINIQALQILRNDNREKEYNFFLSYILDINQGADWADQDFKSTHHFYHPYRKKGLYGRKNALDLAVQYYSRTLDLWKTGDFNKFLFYFGAALHLIHDMSIPQHANIRLLDNHKQYETLLSVLINMSRNFERKKMPIYWIVLRNLLNSTPE